MESTGMQLGFLLLADRAEALNGKIYAMGAGWNQLRFPQLPFQWGFSVAVAVDVPWHLTDQRHVMKVHIEGPDGEWLGDEFELEFEAGRPPGAIEGQDQRMVLALQTQATFEVEGPHAVSVTLADEEVGRSRFSLIRIEQDPDALA
jgi:hypothetical protein